MSVQQRVILWLLLTAALIWTTVGVFSYLSAHHEIDELFDTQQQALAGYVLSSQGLAETTNQLPTPDKRPTQGPEIGDMAIALWSYDGFLLVGSGRSNLLKFKLNGNGFEKQSIAGEPWVVYYQRDDRLRRVVAIGHNADERRELLADLVTSQLMPWLVMLPVLVVGIVVAVRLAFRPLRVLTQALETRGADELTQIRGNYVTKDVAPLVDAMNRLFERIGRALEHERRLTADASHELRTPLAALRAQFDAATLTDDPKARARAMGLIGDGLDRLAHLVDQLLSLSALESSRPEFSSPLQWHAVIQRAIGDALPMLEARRAEIQVVWPKDGVEPLALPGDESLFAMALRNLIDNACRYGPVGVNVEVVVGPGEILVQDDGPGMPANVLERLGARFLRGNVSRPNSSGSGLGISIVARVAELHGLRLEFENLGPASESGAATRSGLRVTLRPMA
ncbi:MAG: ATP-binding protein [Burkholderiaceae bacterium]